MVSLVKFCRQCSTTKDVTEFYKDKNGKDGISYCCKKCSINNSRRTHTIRNYGLTLDEYLAKLEAQESKCSICKGHLLPSGHLTHLDHNHSNGKLRDFLCSACNKGLGYFKENIENLQNTISYIRRHDALYSSLP